MISQLMEEGIRIECSLVSAMKGLKELKELKELKGI